MMQLVQQENLVPLQSPVTKLQNDFSKLAFDISLKDLDLASETFVPWGPYYHIYKMAAIHTAEMLIAITQ